MYAGLNYIEQVEKRKEVKMLGISFIIGCVVLGLFIYFGFKQLKNVRRR